MPPTHVRLAPLAWATALLPLVTMHVCYLLSASEQLIPWCLPWFEGCSSISRASRSGTAYFVFKGMMLPACVLMVLFWLGNRYWLHQQGVAPRVWWWLGMGSAVLLALYTVVLGHIGETFHLLRRIGVTGFFGLTYLAQLGLSSSLRQGLWPRWGQRLLMLCGFTLLVGIASVILGAIWPEWYDTMEDGFEWSLAVLINVHSLLVAWLWQRSGFAMRFSLRH
ncbi:MAG: hypothetical protein MI745_08015 [Pseudomonadales bacterium]|nr:hypothetical protein [Pseudomonadales bacterium]